MPNGEGDGTYFLWLGQTIYLRRRKWRGDGVGTNCLSITFTLGVAERRMTSGSLYCAISTLMSYEKGALSNTSRCVGNLGEQSQKSAEYHVTVI